MKDTDLDINALRAKLMALRESLQDVGSTGNDAAATVELDQTRVGRLSRMDAMQQQAMSVESNRRRQMKLRQIESALKRIDNDDFGVCTDCGEAIAVGRIEYDPSVTLCIECASNSER